MQTDTKYHSLIKFSSVKFSTRSASLWQQSFLHLHVANLGFVWLMTKLVQIKMFRLRRIDYCHIARVILRCWQRNSCIIDGICYREGETSPSDHCLVCKAIDDEYQWTTMPGMYSTDVVLYLIICNMWLLFPVCVMTSYWLIVAFCWQFDFCCFLVLHCCKHMRLSCALNHLLTYITLQAQAVTSRRSENHTDQSVTWK